MIWLSMTTSGRFFGFGFFFFAFGLKFLRGCLVGPYYPYCCLYEYNTAACSLLVMLLSSSVGPPPARHTTCLINHDDLVRDGAGQNGAKRGDKRGSHAIRPWRNGPPPCHATTQAKSANATIAPTVFYSVHPRSSKVAIARGFHVG